MQNRARTKQAIWTFWERERGATQDPERYGSLTWQQRVGESEDLIQELHVRWESIVQDGVWESQPRFGSPCLQ
jgi:hypothetical protein